MSRPRLVVPFENCFLLKQQSTANIIVPVTFLYSQGLDPESLMFRDGRRRIDMVLAFEEEDYGVMTEAEAKKRDHRKTFQVHI